MNSVRATSLMLLVALLAVACSSGSGGTAAIATPPASTPAPTVSLLAAPTSVVSGGSAMLTWSSTNATGCTASGAWTGAQATSGSVSIGPLAAAATYELSCTGPGGTSPESSATVSVTAPPAPPTATVAANPSVVTAAGTSTLTWSSSNATSCVASGGWSGAEPTSGTFATPALSATTTYTLTCTGSGGSYAAAATVTVTNPTAFAVRPANAALTLSETQQFTAAVPGGGSVTWSVDGTAGGNGTVGTVSASGLYTPPASPGTHTVLATSTANPAESGSASLAVTDLAGVFTYHNDLARTGQNLQEYALTPTTVSSSFGKRWSCTVDGDLYAQPLYVANLAIGGGVHNVLFVATQHDSVYAFDADNPGCVTYWQVSALPAGATTIPAADTGAGCTDILTEFGVTGTPVIDPVAQTLYFVAASKESGNYVQRLHALSLATGAEQPNSPSVIEASVVNLSGTTVSFAALWQNQRPALALVAGGVEIAWSAHCDYNNWWGWVMRYDATTLARTAVFNVAPDGVGEGGIWMSGGAPAVDSSDSLYLTTGNGNFDPSDSEPVTPPNNVDFSMSFLNLDATTLAVQDFYTPSQESAWSGADYDISSGGVTVLPDGLGPSGHPNLLVGSDKQAHLWLIDRALMGGYSASADDTLQFLTLPNSAACAPSACVFSTPTFYQPNATVYLAVSNGPLMALPLTNGVFGVAAGKVAVASSASTETYGYPGPTAAISASPAGNPIVWALDTSANGTPSNGGSGQVGPAILRAYAAGGLGTTLYDSSRLAADTAGNAIKFAVPIVANGHVYVAGAHQLTVYGLAP